MIKNILPETATVQRSTSSNKNDFGEDIPSWENIATYRCRVGRLRKGISQKQWGIESDNTTVIYFDSDADIKVKDRIIVNDKTYVVVAVRESRSMKKIHHIEVLTEER